MIPADLHPTVRRAARSDIPALVVLMREFYAESGYTLDEEWATAAFQRLIDDPDLGCVWMAERQGVAAGHTVLTLRYTMEHGVLSGYVDDLFVRPEFRRLGVARALLTELLTECRQRGCRAVCVEVGSANAPAITLYTRFGLKPVGGGRVLLSGELPPDG